MATFLSNDKIHVYPENDLQQHSLEVVTCHCCPDIKYENGVTIVVHNSFDLREPIEWANELLTNPPPKCYKTGRICRYDCNGLCKDS